MRKFLLSAALVAACGMASAQKLTYYPWTSNGYLQAITCSQNGQYIGGEDMGGQAFIADMKTGEIKYFASENLGNEDGTEEPDACVNCVNNDGIGYGYFESHAAKFDFNTGKTTIIEDEEMSLVRSATTDGSQKFGVTYDKAYTQTPCYWNTDGVRTVLPQFSDEVVGYETNGYKAIQVSADGSTILGGVVDNFASDPMVIWHRNSDNQTYSLTVPSKRFFDGSFELDGFQKYDMVKGEAISANGKWVALNMHDKATDESGWTPLYGQVIARYDVEADTLGIIDCPEASADFYYCAYGISNDGTIVGTIEDQASNGEKAMICLAGSNKAQAMSEAFPGINEIKTMDNNEFNVPCGITADGRYIVGYGYVDYDDENLCLGSYVIDTQKATGVDNVANSDDVKSSKVVASYDIDGKKLINPKGNRIVINRLANGKAMKRIMK